MTTGKNVTNRDAANAGREIYVTNLPCPGAVIWYPRRMVQKLYSFIWQTNPPEVWYTNQILEESSARVQAWLEWKKSAALRESEAQVAERESLFADSAFSVLDLQNIPVLVPETSDQTWVSYVGLPRVVDDPSHASGQNALPNSSQQYTGGYTCVFCGFHVQWNTTHDCPRAKENLLRDILTELRALRQELKEGKG